MELEEKVFLWGLCISYTLLSVISYAVNREINSGAQWFFAFISFGIAYVCSKISVSEKR